MNTKSRCSLLILVFVLAFAGCGRSTAVPARVAPLRDTPVVTMVNSPLPLAAITPSPTSTSTAAPAATRTPQPSPTITFTPSVTPTYDPRAARTITSVPAAVCPEVDPGFQPVFIDPKQIGSLQVEDLSGPILNALNQGAGLPALKRAISETTLEGKPAEIPPESIYAKDLTGDGVPEIIFDEDWLVIFTCENGAFREALKWVSGGDNYVEKPLILDLNLDGLVEVIAPTRYYVNYVRDHYFNVLRWNGSDFVDLMGDQDFVISGLINWSARDVDGNGTPEIVIRNWPSTSSDSDLHGPWRHENYTLTWNGTAFVYQSMVLDPPEYRFQAVQDGDRAMRRGAYRDAVKFFQQTIEDPRLKGWGYSIQHHLQREKAQTDQIFRTPTATMLPLDPAEPLFLKAYARFRLVVAYTALGEVDQAKAEYDALQREYAAGKTGSIYAELARVFWDAYKKEGSLDAGCQKLLGYTQAHEEAVLEPLNNYGMGFQNLYYEATDLCLVGE